MQTPFILLLFTFIFNQDNFCQVVIAGDYNYSDPVTQAQIENFTQVLENTSYVSNTLYTESWLRSFIQYYDRNKDYLNVSIDTEVEFIAALKKVKKHTSKNIQLVFN